MEAAYIDLMNQVLSVNYYGEVLTVELLAHSMASPSGYRYRSLLARQLVDETRHANMTRALLLDRGFDPLREDQRTEFTFHELFGTYGGRDEVTLAFLGENERLSSRNFSRLVRIARANEDAPVAKLYSEILNDEVNHAANLFEVLPSGSELIAQTRDEARRAMAKRLNFRYLRLFTAYPAARTKDP